MSSRLWATCSRSNGRRLAASLFLTATVVAALALACTSESRSSRESAQPSTTYSFSVVDGSLPRILFQNRERRARLTLRNDGFNSWQGERTFFFSLRWLEAGGGRLVEDGFRSPVPGGVAPGERVETTVRVKPPQRFGLFRVESDLLSAESGRFQRYDRTPEPDRWIVVLPPLEFLLALLLPCALLARGAVAAARSAPGPAEHDRRWLAFFDLAWCAASLLGKPFVLYIELAPKFWPGPKPVTFSVVALLLLPLLLLPVRIRRLGAWLVVGLGTFLVWAQLLYFRFFLDLASSNVVRAGAQAGDLGETVSFLSKPTDLWLIVDLLIALPLFLWISRRPAPPSRRKARGTALVLAAAAIPFLWSGALALGSGQLQGRRNLQNLRSVSVYGLYGFQLLDAGARTVSRWRRPEVTPEEFAMALEWFEETKPDRRPEAPYAGLAEGLNVIAIQVESMQEFVVDLEIEGEPVMPNLRRRRSTALEFPMMLDQTSRGRSSAGDFAVQTSLIPIGESVAYEYPKNDYYAMARALAQRAGYTTLSAIPYKGSFWNRQATHPAYGYQTNLFLPSFERRGPKVGWGINDRDFFNQIAPVLDSLDEPFFSWLTTLSVHYPYESFPSELKNRSMGRLEGSRLGNYLHGMNYFDRALEEFFRDLEGRGLLDRTVVVIWGDHGSGMIRDEQYIEYFELDNAAKKFIFDRVPFMIWLPSEIAAREVHAQPAGMIDIAPTLLALLGVDPAEIALMGRNLLTTSAGGRVVHPQGKWLDPEFAYLSQFAETETACWSARTLKPVPPKRCRPGTADAERQLEIVGLVLQHDLQARITDRLTEPSSD